MLLFSIPGVFLGCRGASGAEAGRFTSLTASCVSLAVQFKWLSRRVTSYTSIISLVTNTGHGFLVITLPYSSHHYARVMELSFLLLSARKHTHIVVNFRPSLSKNGAAILLLTAPRPTSSKHHTLTYPYRQPWHDRLGFIRSRSHVRHRSHRRPCHPRRRLKISNPFCPWMVASLGYFDT